MKHGECPDCWSKSKHKCDNKQCDDPAMFTMWNKILQAGTNVCYHHYKILEREGEWELRKLEK
jgi:hypothetical protein